MKKGYDWDVVEEGDTIQIDCERTGYCLGGDVIEESVLHDGEWHIRLLNSRGAGITQPLYVSIPEGELGADWYTIELMSEQNTTMTQNDTDAGSNEELVAVYAITGGGYDQTITAVADTEEQARAWIDQQDNIHVEEYRIGSVRYVSTDADYNSKPH